MELIGLLGSICFAISGIPPAYQACKSGVCHYPWAFLLLWSAGELLTTVYVIYKQEWILLLNYGFNFICLVILIKFNKPPS